MRTASYIALFLGLLLASALIGHYGVGLVFAAVGHVGWWVLVLLVWYLAPLMLMAWSWAFVFPPGTRPGVPFLGYANWIGSSVNALLPVATIGGEIVKAVLVLNRGVPGPLAGASVITDKVAQASSQLAFALMGVGALIYIRSGEHDLITGLLGATLFFCALLAAFLWAQQAGMFGWLSRRIEHMARGRLWWNIVGGAEALDRALDEIYDYRARIAWSCTLRLLARAAMVVEVWFALQVMGHPIGWVEALMLESLSQGIRAMAFIVPSGLGAQEGALVLLGHVIGLSPEAALALSLVKRGRELGVSLPALVALQWDAGRRLFADASAPGRD